MRSREVAPRDFGKRKRALKDFCRAFATRFLKTGRILNYLVEICDIRISQRCVFVYLDESFPRWTFDSKTSRGPYKREQTV